MKIIDGKPEYRGALVSVDLFEFVCCMNWWTHFCVWKKNYFGCKKQFALCYLYSI